MLSECSPGLANASRSTPIAEPSLMVTIGVLRLRASPPWRIRAALSMTAGDLCIRLSQKSTLRESLAGSHSCQIFTIPCAVRTAVGGVRENGGIREISAPSYIFLAFVCKGCTKIRHASVDGLHSVENKQDKVAKIFLTSALAGVEPHSFFDSFVSVSKSAETTG